jgi:hypothetical protein
MQPDRLQRCRTEQRTEKRQAAKLMQIVQPRCVGVPPKSCRRWPRSWSNAPVIKAMPEPACSARWADYKAC